jgi:hypothetical protein
MEQITLQSLALAAPMLRLVHPFGAAMDNV